MASDLSLESAQEPTTSARRVPLAVINEGDDAGYRDEFDNFNDLPLPEPVGMGRASTNRRVSETVNFSGEDDFHLYGDAEY